MNDAIMLAGATLVGACIGSFTNVVIYRLPLGKEGELGSRSVCPKCKKRIAWFDNVPIVSWLLLRARARCCGARISARYPLVEALMAVLFACVWWRLASGASSLDAKLLLAFVLQAFFVWNLVANTFIDIDHRILPDALTYPGMVVGMVGSLVAPPLAGTFEELHMTPAANSFLFSAVGLLAGAGSTWLVRELGTRAFRKEAMGLGDVKLMGVIGAFVGWDGVLVTLLLASLLGAVVGIWYQIRTGQAQICFGPFLAAGALIALFARAELWHLLLVTLPQAQRGHPSVSWIMIGLAGLSLVALFLLVRRGRRS